MNAWMQYTIILETFSKNTPILQNQPFKYMTVVPAVEEDIKLRNVSLGYLLAVPKEVLLTNVLSQFSSYKKHLWQSGSSKAKLGKHFFCCFCEKYMVVWILDRVVGLLSSLFCRVIRIKT